MRLNLKIQSLEPEIQQILYFQKSGNFQNKECRKIFRGKTKEKLYKMDFWINIFDKKLPLQFSADLGVNSTW